MHRYSWASICDVLLISFHTAVAAFVAAVSTFIRWGVAQAFPDPAEPARRSTELYAVAYSRDASYADHRRGRFNRRHVDQGWLAAA